MEPEIKELVKIPVCLITLFIVLVFIVALTPNLLTVFGGTDSRQTEVDRWSYRQGMLSNLSLCKLTGLLANDFVLSGWYSVPFGWVDKAFVYSCFSWMFMVYKNV